MGQEWCGKWMPRKKTTCARTPGHRGDSKTAETMARNRLYRRDHPHRESPESRKKSNRKYRISSYGLTQELFDLPAGNLPGEVNAGSALKLVTRTLAIARP
jgi:hypothetical protein